MNQPETTMETCPACVMPSACGAAGRCNAEPEIIGVDMAATKDCTVVCCPQPIGGVCPACGEMDGSGYCGAIGMERGRTVVHIRDLPRSPWK